MMGWIRKARTLVIINLLAGGAILLALAAPRPVSSDALGGEWQCSKAAFVLTTCHQRL
ncbi:hypothetical protein [Bradyrhizobium sp. LTSPM299]|uniref:hypothetical protein n=1 Tax=Bradyrhizobium sp. LTSPM299 TaxID=1619233 RepID=UPI000AAD9CB0|nr:hypothetical protein [Bradyrhizobium sp. LTSPM299]